MNDWLRRRVWPFIRIDSLRAEVRDLRKHTERLEAELDRRDPLWRFKMYFGYDPDKPKFLEQMQPPHDY
jgi:hypothetical protein